MRRFLRFIRHVVFASISIATPIQAGDTCCRECGCSAPCRQICRLVCEEKEVEVECWGYQCTDFCVPGPSKPGCKHCSLLCGDCDHDADVMTHPKKFVWRDWFPGCATVHTKTSLMKGTTKKKVASHKWVVEDVCETCAAKQVNDELLR